VSIASIFVRQSPIFIPLIPPPGILPPVNSAKINAKYQAFNLRDSITPLKQKGRVLSVRVAAGVLRLSAGFLC